jgi:hypothetical protein
LSIHRDTLRDTSRGTLGGALGGTFGGVPEDTFRGELEGVLKDCGSVWSGSMLMTVDMDLLGTGELDLIWRRKRCSF